MTPELDKKLCDKYTGIFRDRHAPMTETCMCWGIECEDGWYDIIDKGCAELSALPGVEIIADQVKQKYGGLRFRMHVIGDNEESIAKAEEIVDRMELEAWDTCEYCGSKEDMCTTTGYYIRLCHTCAIHTRRTYTKDSDPKPDDE